MVQINDQKIVVRQSPSSRIHDDSARRSLSHRLDGCELENRIETIEIDMMHIPTFVKQQCCSTESYLRCFLEYDVYHVDG